MPYSSVREIELIETGSLGKEVLSNDAFVNLERGISGTATLVLSNADYPLSATEGQAFVLILTGTVTDDLALIVPQESRVYVVDNRCTIVGTHSITMRPPVGGGVTVETGYQRALMYCDGSNVYPVASGVAAGGGSGAPTDATYLVGSAHALLTGERVVTDTSTITWDLATAGQAKALIPPNAVSYTHLQDVASSRILGRFTGGAGDVQEITPGAGLTLDAGTGVLSATAVGQPLDATLTALAGLATGPDQLPYATGTDTFMQTTLTPFARTLLDDVNQAAAQATLGVVPGTQVQAQDATLTALAGVSTGADTLPFFTGTDTASTTVLTAFMRGLLDDTDAATARTTLGVTGGGGGSSDFLGLSDTPDAYTGQGGKVVAVNSGATALEFVTGVGTTAALGAVVQRVATQGIVQNTNTVILFDTQTRDDSTFWVPGDPGTLTVPTTGWYSITAFVQWDATTGNTRIVNVRVNGTQYIAVTSEGNAGVDQRQTVAVNWYLTAGDYVEMVLFQSTAGTRQITANASIVAVTAAPDPATTFLALADTPDTYTGQAGKVVKVNAGATALEFGTMPGAGQPLDATLTALAGLATGANQLPYATGADTFAQTTLSAYIRTLLDDADAATARGTLLLGTLAQQDANAVAITGGSATGLTGTPAVQANDSPGDNVAGFQSLVSASGGSNRWNIHAPGTAANFFGGQVQVGGPTLNNTRLSVAYPKANEYGLSFKPTDNDTGPGWAINFLNTSLTSVGSINTTATATTYATSSDVRLKHAITALAGALERVRALRPVSFRWNVDDSVGVGFLAHELQATMPEAVSGEPDALNDDGTIRPQGVDHAKLVPHLVAACQELATQVQALTARLTLLEAHG